MMTTLPRSTPEANLTFKFWLSMAIIVIVMTPAMYIAQVILPAPLTKYTGRDVTFHLDRFQSFVVEGKTTPLVGIASSEKFSLSSSNTETDSRKVTPPFGLPEPLWILNTAISPNKQYYLGQDGFDPLAKYRVRVTDGETVTIYYSTQVQGIGVLISSLAGFLIILYGFSRIWRDRS